MSEESSSVMVGREPCPSCGSRDNLTRYDDGHAYCFTPSCEHYEMRESPNGEFNSSVVDVVSDDSHPAPDAGLIDEIEYVALPHRHISEETCRRYKYGVGKNDQGTPVQIAHYGTSQKCRTADKKFFWIGKPPGLLFGQHLWKGGKKLVITEGEIDALSYAEATGCRWPVVSVPNGAGGAAKDLAKQIEFVEQFEEVIFLFDMDEPGQKAAEQCAQMLTPGKARIGTLPRKDPNEVLIDLGPSELSLAVFKARVYRPDGIIEGIDMLDVILTAPEKGLSYPWEFMDPYLHGMRRGEMVTWIAGTGAGKSQIMREIAHHLWRGHGERLGYIALEESNRETALGQISLELQSPLHVPEVFASTDPKEIERAAASVLKGFAFYDHWGSVEAGVLLPKIRYMTHAMGIRWFILDHLSIMVSGQADEGDERKRLDSLTTKLRSLVSELDIGLHIVSHLRKASGTPHEEGGRISLQDIRGSGAPAQLSNMVIAAERNQQADGCEERNTTHLRILKNRLTGQTGLAGSLHYNSSTGRLAVADVVQEEGGEDHGDF